MVSINFERFMLLGIIEILLLGEELQSCNDEIKM